MANTLKVKRSAVPGKVPAVTDLELGELAINTYDGKLFLKKDVNGTAQIVDVSAGVTAQGLLDLIKLVDGVGSGLDADLLDGLSGSDYSRSAVNVDITSLQGITGGISTAQFLDFSTTNNVTPQRGRLWYSPDDDTLNIGHDSGIVQQVGQEFFYPPCKNTSGTSIPNGRLVMSTGSQGDKITIAAAITDGTIEPDYIIGVTTHEVTADSEFGMIITDGVVRDINTSIWAPGTILYPDPQNPGALTATKPTAPAIRTPIAIVLRQHASTGRIYVRMSVGSKLGGSDSNVEFGTLANNDLIVYNGTLNRWENKAQSTVAAGTASKLATARTLTIGNTGKTFDGSANVSWTLGELGAVVANTAITGATATKITYDSKGLVTSGTTLVAADIPNLDTSKITTGTFTAARMPAFTGDATSTAGTSSLTLANSGVTAATYGGNNSIPSIAVDAKGRVTSASTITPSGTWGISVSGSAATLTTGYTIGMTGDVTWTSASFNGSGNVTGVATLASVGTSGTYTKVTTDGKGRVTSGTTLSASDIPALDASKITSGTIDAARLPSYVDDVLEYTNLAAFPATGEAGKIYIALDTNKTYRWSGSAYVYITSGAVDSVAGKTGVVVLDTLTRGTGLTGNNYNGSAASTWAVSYGSTAGTAVQGNDTRVTADQAAATASIRTLGTGAQQAAAGNHTHNYAGSASAGGAANSVANSLTLKFGSGTTEGTNQYTFNGTAAKTVDIRAGTNVTLTEAAGVVTINATDTNTTYSAGNGISLTSTTFSVAGGNGLVQETSGLALGTPSTLTTSTTNAVTTTSHTHAVTFPVTSVNTKTGAITLTASDVGAAASSHTHSYLPLSGGGLTGLLYTAGNTAAFNSANDTTLSIRSSGASTAAAMTFHRPGAYAVNLGLDTDNVFKLGGWSASTVKHSWDMSGNYTAVGNITAYSDVRLKTDIHVISNALEKVGGLRGVTYLRKDTAERQTGVIAQEVQAVLPEAVRAIKGENDEEVLSVAYGNMVGLLIEAIKEQQVQITELKRRIS